MLKLFSIALVGIGSLTKNQSALKAGISYFRQSLIGYPSMVASRNSPIIVLLSITTNILFLILFVWHKNQQNPNSIILNQTKQIWYGLQFHKKTLQKRLQKSRSGLKIDYNELDGIYLSWSIRQTLQLTKYEMKKAMTEILQVRTNPDKVICMSITEKQSDLGISFNKRLFILIKNDKFGYISNFKQTDKPEDIDISKCKTLIENKRISSDVERNKQIISINFTVTEDKKKVAKKWVLKMSTEELAKQWEKLINEERQKRSTSRNQSAIRSPKNRNIQKQIQQLPENSGSKLTKMKEEPKKDFLKQKNQPLEKQEYKNALYETQNKEKFILDSQQKPQKINKKLEYSEENKLPKDKAALLQQKQEEEKIKKQRAQLAKKEKELKDWELKISQQKKRIDEQKRLLQEEKIKEEIKNKNQQLRKSEEVSNLEEKNRKEAVKVQEEIRKEARPQEGRRKEEVSQQKQTSGINQRFFNQEKPPNQKESNVKKIETPNSKESNIKKIEQSANKPKPKLEGLNYSQFVQNILFSKVNQERAAEPKQVAVVASPSESSLNNKKLEQVHDYLLELEELKFKNKEPEKIEPKKVDNLPLELGWTFRYLIKQAEGLEDEIIEQFNYFCSSILKEVVHEFHLPQKKRVYLPLYRRQQFFLYQKDDIQFKVAFVGLKEIYNPDQPSYRDNICDQRGIKMLENQFKNYHLLHKAQKQMKVRHFRTPLACLCQYEGFVAFFKARSQFDTQPNLSLDKKVQHDLQLISQNTKILGSVLKSKQTLLILKLNNQYYRELAAQTGTAYTNFDYFFVEEIKYLMPPDLLFPRGAGKQSPEQKAQNIHFLRSELLINHSESRQDMDEVILETVKKTNKSATKSPNTELEKLSKNIHVSIAELIKELDSLTFCFVHPKELEDKMHEMGINMRYLGMIYENCKLKFIKSFIMSEMASRVARALFRKTIQDYHMKQSSGQENSYNNSVRIQIIDYLNWVLGSSSETATIWKVLSIHSLDYFNLHLAIDEIQKGYFVRSLMFHCGVEVDWGKISMAKAFVSNEFFDEDSFIDVKVKIKGYIPALIYEEKCIVGRMIDEDPTVFKFLEEQYNIQSKTLPLKFRHPQYFDIFRKYLSNFVPPDSGIHRGYKLLNLYTAQNRDITRCQFSLRLMELKWHLKRQRKQKYINVFSEINQMVTNNFGDFHPLLSQLYEVMCIYHRNNAQFEDAITFSKSSVINMLKVCGASHQRVGQCYYQMALCCIKGGKKQQAIISLQKAKNIFEANQREYEVSYAHVCLKLGLLFLSEGKTSQAENIVKFSLSLFNRHLGDSVKNHREEIYEEERVQCFEILARCYQLNDVGNLQKQLSLECQKEIRHIQTPTNFEKVLKIVLYPILSSLKPSDANSYIELIAQIPLEINVNTYMQGYERLKMRVDEDGLIENLSRYTENIKSIEQFIKQNNSLKEWHGFEEVYERETVNDFISLTEELIYFLGEGFVTGTIRDSL